MRRAATIAFLAALALTSCGAVLKVGGHAPAHVNDGTCVTRMLQPANDSMWVHARLVGRAEHDSVRLRPGEAFEFSWAVPSGRYQVTAWACNRSGAGCETTITVAATSTPDRVPIYQGGAR